jgi:hypothetical protein
MYHGREVFIANVFGAVPEYCMKNQGPLSQLMTRVPVPDKKLM